jgi:NAD(P)-dependent dehydrogenase (short-subunit alcohol dehydrogenase family)
VAKALAERGGVVAADIGCPIRLRATLKPLPHLDDDKASDRAGARVVAFGRSICWSMSPASSRAARPPTSPRTRDSVMRINLKDTFLCSQAVMPRMKAALSAIVNLSSVVGKRRQPAAGRPSGGERHNVATALKQAFTR